MRRAAIAAGVCLVSVAALAHAIAPTPGAQTPAQPNIVFILTDDQTAEQMRVMPRTRNLIRGQGVKFGASYISYPLCCPARGAGLTGQYNHNNGVLQNGGPNGGYHTLDNSTTIAVALENAGYRTVHIGKYLNGYGYSNPRQVPQGWNEWHAALCCRNTYDDENYYYRYWLNNNGGIDYYGTRPDKYKTDVLRRFAVHKIRKFADERPDQPFFINVAFNAPHWPWTPAPRHAGYYRNAKLPRPPGFNEADMSDKARWLRNATSRLSPHKIDRIRANYRRRLATLVTVDTAVKKIIRTLSEEGKLSNTYIVFASDNGFFTGQHRIPDGKYLGYEPSSRVPLMIRGPGIPRGGTSEEHVSNVDWTPTLLEVAGASPPPGVTVDGRSLLPYAQDPSLRSDRPLLLESIRWGDSACGGVAEAGVSDLNQDGTRLEDSPDASAAAEISGKPYRAIRAGRYMLIEYSNCQRELYDLRTDPYQLQARHGSGRYSELFDVLRGELRRLSRCTGDACRQDAPPLPTP